MNKRIALLMPFLVLPLGSCSFVKGLEHDLTVTYMYNGEIIDSKKVNEFTNCLQPTLSEAQIPLKHEFYGWTWLNPDSIKITEEGFDSKYIAYDEVVHYAEVKDHASNGNVTLYPLFINEKDIPIPNYYIAIGWYAKSSTSGLTDAIMNNWAEDLKTYLKSEGASDEDLANVVIKGYQGDVATAGSLVNKDRFIDVLIGFGNNINTTGGVEVIEKDGGITMGGKSRYIARLTEKDIAKKVYDWLQTDDGNHSLAG